MAEYKPTRIVEVEEEDTQEVQTDVFELAQKYIVPIDRIRSIVKPGPAALSSDTGFDNLDLNTRMVESRAHAFLRYVGFPVVAGNNSEFYNPGFDPTGQFIGTLAGQAKLKSSVLSKFTANSVLKSMVSDREQDAISLRQVFEARDFGSIVYALVLHHVRPFKLFDAGDPFAKQLQKSTNDSRKTEAEQFFSRNENADKADAITALIGTEIGSNFSGIRHILHPFVVDPRIDNTVMPDRNLIAVPFLQSKEDLKLDNDVYVLRPGVELIIRERLRDSANEAKSFFQTLEKMIKNEYSPLPDSTVRTENELRLAVEALLDENKIDQNAINEEISNISTIQAKTIKSLVKTIRTIVGVLKKSIDKINMARQKINWAPIPSSAGPEVIQDSVVSLNQDGMSTYTEIDKKILKLKMKKFLAEHKTTGENEDIGGFASPFEICANDLNIEKNDELLNDLICQRDNLANEALKALQSIEIISGEVSGLGLLDILAIYTALWAVEEKALISLLDDQAFNRLITFFPDLKVGAAADRAESSANKYDIKTALEKFEHKLVNIFSFIDREIQRQGVAPGEEPGGTVNED